MIRFTSSASWKAINRKHFWLTDEPVVKRRSHPPTNTCDKPRVGDCRVTGGIIHVIMGAARPIWRSGFEVSANAGGPPAQALEQSKSPDQTQSELTPATPAQFSGFYSAAFDGASGPTLISAILALADERCVGRDAQAGLEPPLRLSPACSRLISYAAFRLTPLHQGQHSLGR